jgi:hypothetical protein
MKHLKSFKQFEDVTANASTAGMGAVVSSQPSSIPGALNGPAFVSGGGSSGSGDLGFPLLGGKKETKQKKKIGKKTTKDAGDLRYLGKENILDKFPVKN